MTQRSIEQNQNLIRTHHLFELKGIEEMKMSQQDKLLSMSPEAQITLMKLGTEWQATTGYSSWVDDELLVSLIRIPDEAWTINKLSKWSGFGRSGIEYSLIPFMEKVGIMIHDSSSRFTKYSITVHGRETLEAMVYNCSTCDNTRKCAHCETGIGITTRYTGDPVEPCDHTLHEECIECNKTGLMDCGTCSGTGELDDWNREGTHNKPCYRCVERGHPSGKTSCDNSITNCGSCINNSRVKKCDWCTGYTTCRSCESRMTHLTYNNETRDYNIDGYEE